MNTRTTTLHELLKNLDDTILLSDGAIGWIPQNLLEALEQAEDGQETLAQEVSSNHVGIYPLKADGYQDSQPRWTYRYPEIP